MRIRLAAVACIFGVFLVGCAGSGTDASPTAAASVRDSAARVYVGKVDGTDAYIALVATADHLTDGYICDSETVATWVSEAGIDAREVELADREGNRIGTATFDAGRVRGRITAAGGTHRFSAKLAEGKAGLYRKITGTRGEPGYEETGWIVLADGSVRGRTLFGSGGIGGRSESKAAATKPAGDSIFIGNGANG
jgi:hypothetical protein